MTGDTIKGFIFGAALMMVMPAFAITAAPPPSIVDALDPVAEASTEATAANFRLSYEEVEEALAQALADRGAGGKVAVSISNRNEPYVFSYNQPISVEIRGLRFDAAMHRFSANLVAIADQKIISAKPVAGRVEEVIELPVLKRSLRAGEVIQASDLELRDYPQARMRSDTISDMASLVGKSPERVISSGRPIREQELQQPSVVHKNDLVKMVFQQGGMTISTVGQALVDGAQGAVISVKNTASKKIVQATVHNANTVLVDHGDVQTSSLDMGERHEN